MDGTESSLALETTDARPAETNDAAILRAYLADRDSPCPQCGYNLRQLAADRCPECGEPLRLTVGLQNPRFGWLILLISVCGAGFGGSLLFVALAVMQAPSNWWSEVCARILVAQLILCGALLPAIWLGRTRFRRASPLAQRLLTFAMAAVVLSLWALFIAYFDG